MKIEEGRRRNNIQPKPDHGPIYSPPYLYSSEWLHRVTTTNKSQPITKHEYKYINKNKNTDCVSMATKRNGSLLGNN